MKVFSQVFIGLGFLVLVAACGKNDNNNNQTAAGTCQAGYVASTNGSQTYCCPQSGTAGQCYALNQTATCQAGYISNGQNQCCPQNGQGQCYTVATTPNQSNCPVATPYNGGYYGSNPYNTGCTQPYPPTGYPPTGAYPPYGGSPYGNYYGGYPMPKPMPMPFGGFSASVGFGTGMGMPPMPMPYGGYGGGMPTYYNQNGGYNNYGPY